MGSCSRALQPRFKGGGDAGRIPSPTAVCTKRKSANEGCHRESRKFSRRPAQRAWRFFARMPQAARAFAIRAITHDGLYGLFRAAPGGRTKLSSAGGPSRLRRYALARARTKPPSKALVTSGRLAGTTRLQPLRARVRYARNPQPPFPIHTSNTPRDAPLMDQDKKEYNPSLGWKCDG
jgi:hypothetical protein